MQGTEPWQRPGSGAWGAAAGPSVVPVPEDMSAGTAVGAAGPGLRVTGSAGGAVSVAGVAAAGAGGSEGSAGVGFGAEAAGDVVVGVGFGAEVAGVVVGVGFGAEVAGDVVGLAGLAIAGEVGLGVEVVGLAGLAIAVGLGVEVVGLAGLAVAGEVGLGVEVVGEVAAGVVVAAGGAARASARRLASVDSATRDLQAAGEVGDRLHDDADHAAQERLVLDDAGERGAVGVVEADEVAADRRRF